MMICVIESDLLRTISTHCTCTWYPRTPTQLFLSGKNKDFPRLRKNMGNAEFEFRNGTVLIEFHILYISSIFLYVKISEITLKMTNWVNMTVAC